MGTMAETDHYYQAVRATSGTSVPDLSTESYCYYPGYNYNNRPCQATGNTSTVQCSGFLYDNSNGCIELAVPIDNAYWAETRIYQYYTLVNLPSYYALTRSWVTVTGQTVSRIQYFTKQHNLFTQLHHRNLNITIMKTR